MMRNIQGFANLEIKIRVFLYAIGKIVFFFRAATIYYELCFLILKFIVLISSIK